MDEAVWFGLVWFSSTDSNNPTSAHSILSKHAVNIVIMFYIFLMVLVFLSPRRRFFSPTFCLLVCLSARHVQVESKPVGD